MKLIMPFPPSANRYWRSITVRGQARVLISAEARAYKRRIAEDGKALKAKPLEGKVAVQLIAYRPRRIGNLDNTLKVTLDALQGIAYLDDEQIVEIHAYRCEDKADPRIEVEVREVDMTAQLWVDSRACANSG